MSKINEKMFEKVSLYNMTWEKQELENIIEEKKNELEEKYLDRAVGMLIGELAEGKQHNEKEIKEFLIDFMKIIREVEREI